MAIDLPELSAKLCSLHGTHRSQYVAEATSEIIQSITAMLRQTPSKKCSDRHGLLLPKGIPSEVVYDISELCAPFVDNEEIKPLVDALLQCNIGAVLPESNKTGLSPAFVHSISDKGIELSYASKVALWTKDISAFEHYVIATVRSVTHCDRRCSDSDVEEVLTRSHLVQACCQHSQLFHHIRDLLKSDLVASRGAEAVVNIIKMFHKLFRQELTSSSSQQLVPLSTYCYYPTHLHPLLQLMTATACDPDQLWVHIDRLMNTVSGSLQLRTVDVWLVLIEFDQWRDGDDQRLRLAVNSACDLT